MSILLTLPSEFQNPWLSKLVNKSAKVPKQDPPSELYPFLPFWQNESKGSKKAESRTRRISELSGKEMIGFSLPMMVPWWITARHTLKDAISRYNDGQDITDQLPDIPFHGLRHTSATLLISTKPDVATVSKRLGHAHTSVTLDIYTHALEENERSASDALEALLGK